jgi:hypothetical protein
MNSYIATVTKYSGRNAAVGQIRAHVTGVQLAGSWESRRYTENWKFFPTPLLKILPAGLLSIMASGILSGCHASTLSVEASTTRVPVVAPAGTVLRVRLSENLDSERSRPGDRFTGVLDSPVMAGTMQVLAKGTSVEGHVLSARASGKDGDEAWLSVTLDSFERDGRIYGLATSAVARVAYPSLNNTGMNRNKNPGWNVARISLPAESIIGFTLTNMLAA